MRSLALVVRLAAAAPAARLAAQPAAAPPAPDTAARHTASPDTAPAVTLGAFVDGYYAYDVGRPPSHDHAFAGGALFGTQPARHNEFNVNLAFAEARLDAPHYRGRLAVQFGTSVQANYLGEPRTGRVSGPDVQQYLQEAVAGVRVARRLWVDGGIFFSNAGMESWISRDNPTYTRSLVADYSPYYSAGVKLTYAATPTLTARLDVVNGWQTIAENNQGKAAGLRLDYAPNGATTLSYYDFFGEEAGTRLRMFHGVGAKVVRGPLTLLGEADVGTQRRPADRPAGAAGSSTWYGLLAVVRAQIAPRVALAGRLERYDDPDQVILSTGTRTVAVATPGGAGATAAVPNPAFRGNGASLGVDVQPVGGAGSARVLWRTEVRGFRTRDALFPNGAAGAPRRTGGFAVTSLALTF